MPKQKMQKKKILLQIHRKTDRTTAISVVALAHFASKPRDDMQHRTLGYICQLWRVAVGKESALMKALALAINHSDRDPQTIRSP